MKRSGIADLPLHGGRVPQWLAERMTKLGTAIAETIIVRYGRSELLSRLSDPFWFQAFGSVMGMDWHSSGITTSVMGALKRGLHSRSDELGIYICGGRGRHSRNTPDELRAVSERRGFDGEALVRTSRLTARIDNNAIADGFQIYLHTFIVSAEGEWAVVQQGLNDQSGLARRYHWHSAAVRDFTADPHTGIVGDHQGEIMNLSTGTRSPPSWRCWTSFSKSQSIRFRRPNVWSFQRGTMFVQRMLISKDWALFWRSRTSANFTILPSCCCSRSLGRERYRRLLLSRKSYTARRRASWIPQDSRSRSAVRIVILFRCR